MLMCANFVWWIPPLMLHDVDVFQPARRNTPFYSCLDFNQKGFSDQCSMIMSVRKTPFTFTQCGGSVSRGPHRVAEKPTVEGGAGEKQPPTDGPLRCLCRHCQQDQPVKWQGKRLLCEENFCQLTTNPSTD